MAKLNPANKKATRKGRFLLGCISLSIFQFPLNPDSKYRRVRYAHPAKLLPFLTRINIHWARYDRSQWKSGP
jgi:hypothetical protein